MEKEHFIDNVLKQAAESGFSESEVYYQKGNALQVQIQDSCISQYENNTQQGVCFRGLRNGQMGYAYSEKLEDDAIPFLLEQAKQNAEIMDGDTEFLFEGNLDKAESFRESKKYLPIQPEQIIADAKQMERSAKEENKFIKMTETCSVSYSEDEIFIKNTKGLCAQRNDQMYFAYVSSIAENQNDRKTGDEFWVGRDYSSFSPQKTGCTASSKAASHLGAKSIPSNSYTVILKNLAACDLLATFAGVFFAENAQKGFSLLSDRVGKQIASTILTLRDDGFLEQGLTRMPFDSEGVKTKQKAIIENGVLRTLLHNLKTADKEGLASTGNGFKPSLQASVQTSYTNFYIKNGTLSLSQLLKKMDTGLFVTSVAGLHAGANPISGDFSLSAEGFFIEDGESKYPVEQITIAGNFYELLKGVFAIADDLRFQPMGGVGCIGSPAILIKELSISGI